ncbi:unnamed protein product, partial [Sphagnum troendelagicum]
SPSSGSINRPWSGRLRHNSSPTNTGDASYKGKEKVGEALGMPDISVGYSHVDGESSGSEQSLDEEFGIPTIKTPRFVGLAALGGIALTLAKGGPTALMAAIAKSGFSAAFALIFVSEIGDKTFFIAALLAMQYSRLLVLLGASAALSLMTVISVVIGRLFQSVPAQLQTTLPIGEYAAVALLIWFGIRSIKSAWDLPSEIAGTQDEASELAEAEEFLKKTEAKKMITPFEVVTEAFSLVFVAEWGDRSMLATVALGAAQSPWGVASGAIAGHVIATALAVLGGAFLAQYISEKLVGYIGGVLFLVFAAATLLGVF